MDDVRAKEWSELKEKISNDIKTALENDSDNKDVLEMMLTMLDNTKIKHGRLQI